MAGGAPAGRDRMAIVAAVAVVAATMAIIYFNFHKRGKDEKNTAVPPAVENTPVNQQHAEEQPDAGTDTDSDSDADIVPSFHYEWGQIMKCSDFRQEDCCEGCYTAVNALTGCTAYAVIMEGTWKVFCLECLATEHCREVHQGREPARRIIPDGIVDIIANDLFKNDEALTGRLETMLATLGPYLGYGELQVEDELLRLVIAARFNVVKAHRMLLERMTMACLDPRAIDAGIGNIEDIMPSDLSNAVQRQQQLYQEVWDRLGMSCRNPALPGLTAQHEAVGSQLINTCCDSIDAIAAEAAP
eukprot:TRINITY_DN31421_c0_g1_i1.p2 TRINITY_DN31421_c0_g1~~TRINITY_DN31421_c0_g1_i1.p2  ORF type:complete len:301 (+),score=91.22 TRINITY_DN31421_c0_g1_i1:85-987(+)